MIPIIVTIVIFGLLPICFKRPWIGVLVWSWLGYMNPHRLTYGLAYNMPFAQLVAVAIIGGLFFTNEKRPLPPTREVYLLIALWGMFFLSTLFAIDEDFAWQKFFELSKIFFLTFIAIILLQEPKKIKALIWIIALSLGFYGLKGGIWAVLTGGQNQVLGPPGTFIEGNTNLGLALVMVLPCFLFLRKEESRQWLRHFLLAMFFCTIIAILITYSRGALLGLIAVLLLFTLKTRYKMLAIVFLVLSVFVVVNFLPEKWIGRMRTIETYEEDGSAMGRIRAWEVSYRLALDHPFVGGGFGCMSEELYFRYLSDDLLKSADLGTGSHSIYFHMMAEHGFTGLILYLSLIFSCIISLRNIRKITRGNLSMQWAFNCANCIEISFAGFLVSGVFLSMTYFDLLYALVAISILLKKVVLVKSVEKRFDLAVTPFRSKIRKFT